MNVVFPLPGKHDGGESVRTQDKLDQFEGLYGYIQMTFKMEEEAPSTIGGKHDLSNLDDFLAPFRVHWGKGQHVQEVKGSADLPQVGEELPPVRLHIQSAPTGGRAVTVNEAEAILHRQEDDLARKKTQPK